MDKVSTYSIRRYRPEDAGMWDEFVARSRNATFLFIRDYMDYHSDRFADRSLIACKEGKPIALLPACELPGSILSTHAGLTYGGWLLPPAHLDGAMLLSIFEVWLDYCRSEGIRRIVYKTLPDIYALTPTQEDRYALWRTGFRPLSVLLSSAVDLRCSPHFNMSKRQQVRKAQRDDVRVEESTDWAGFYQLLCDCLAERHEAAPVHSLDELMMLADRFHDNIRLFTVSSRDGIEAGVCIYDTGIVARSQYAATTPLARKRYYLTLLYHYLLTKVFAHRRYFDFGTSNEEQGRLLNNGLLNQKFSMGATGVACESYFLDL